MDNLNAAIVHTAGTVRSDSRIRSASKYVTPLLVVTATRRGKPHRRDTRLEMVLTIGRPNFRGRAFVKACRKAGEPFPVRKVQLRWMKGRKPA